MQSPCYYDHHLCRFVDQYRIEVTYEPETIEVKKKYWDTEMRPVMKQVPVTQSFYNLVTVSCCD